MRDTTAMNSEFTNVFNVHLLTQLQGPAEDVSQPCLGLDAVELGAPDQCRQDRSPLSAAVAGRALHDAAKTVRRHATKNGRPSLSAKSPFGSVVVERDEGKAPRCLYRRSA